MTDRIKSNKPTLDRLSLSDVAFSELDSMEISSSVDITHYGIKGMKWGVRRSQATLDRLAGRTTSTRSERSSRKKKETKVRKVSNWSAKRDRKEARRSRRYLTTEEIRERVSRLKLESEFKTLTDKDVSSGSTFIKSVIRDSGKTVLTTAVTGISLWAIKAYLDKEFRTKKAAASFINLKKK